ncbi:hypothetical protein ACFOW1_12435 [Parasediminibacterium paludis]|uniref:Peptidase M23-like protein n=1 Tax=Parasediminibacterium paludis TaxID=908966 RepID=A0ABV8Q0H6_9BACT
MRNALFFIILAFAANTLQAQIDSTKAFESCRGKLPLPVKHFTKVIDNSKNSKNVCMYQFNPSTAFISDKQDSVFSIHEGSVVSVYEVDSSNFAIMIKYGQYFLVYFPIDAPFLKKGDYIKAKQFIGFLKKEYEDYRIQIQLYNKQMKEFVAYNWFKWP